MNTGTDRRTLRIVGRVFAQQVGCRTLVARIQPPDSHSAVPQQLFRKLRLVQPEVRLFPVQLRDPGILVQFVDHFVQLGAVDREAFEERIGDTLPLQIGGLPSKKIRGSAPVPATHDDTTIPPHTSEEKMYGRSFPCELERFEVQNRRDKDDAVHGDSHVLEEIVGDAGGSRRAVAFAEQEFG